MNRRNQKKDLWSRLRKPVLGGAILACLLILALSVWSLMGGGWRETGQPLVTYQVKTSDLPIVVTERGELESQVQTTLRCDVESSSVDRSGNFGTQIIYIVPNGSKVEQDQLLVELDSATIRERIDQQTVTVEKAVLSRISSEVQHENQALTNENSLEQAKLLLELAKLELEMYKDPSNGTLKLALEEIDRQIDDANNAILEARAALELQKNEKSGVEQLFRLGYRGENELNQSHLALLQAEDKLGSAVNKLMTYQSNRRKLENYEQEMQTKQLEGNVNTAIRGLAQVQNDNKALLLQTSAQYDESQKTEQKEKERLQKMEDQLANCKIVAPHEGMVVYARDPYRRSSSTPIAEGATVRQRQPIINLPNLTLMQVDTKVHEAVLDQVRPGLPVTVRIDAFPDQVYEGVVHEVGVVPESDSYYSSGVKTYKTVVRILGEVENLKPGMTAVVEIHVDRIRDVLSVPVHAVVQRGSENWCYVKSPRGVEQRMLALGRSNDKFVHVKDGLSEGDAVVINPMAIYEEESEDAANAISPEEGAPDVPDVDPETLAEAAENAQAGEATRGGGQESNRQPNQMRSQRGKGGEGPPGGNGGRPAQTGGGQ